MSAAANLLPDRNDARIRLAQSADVEALAGLINMAFRVELPFIEGDRINPDGVRAYMKKGRFFLAETSSGLAGCVYVEVRGDRGYLGLLGVEPRSQGTGLGRKLMDDVEVVFRTANCAVVDLRIGDARDPLRGFSRHLGYAETGRAPLPPDAPVKVPCHFILMSKMLI